MVVDARQPHHRMLAQQVGLAASQFLSRGIIFVKAGELALDADELGAVGVSVVVEPVGEHQARSIVVGMLGDILNEGFLVIQGRLLLGGLSRRS
jgi:hypothetical protein